MLLCQAYLDHHRFGTYGRPHLQCAEPCHSPSTTLIPSLITLTALTQSSHVFFFDNLGFPPTLPSCLTGLFLSKTSHTCAEQLAAFCPRQAHTVFGDTSVTWLCPRLSQNCYFHFLWHPLSPNLHHLLLTFANNGFGIVETTLILLSSPSSVVVSLSLRPSSSVRFPLTTISLWHWGVSTTVITRLLSSSTCPLWLSCTGYMTI